MLELQSTTRTAAFELFDLDNQARRSTAATLEFYRYRIPSIIGWCEGRNVIHFVQLTPAVLRAYLVDL